MKRLESGRGTKELRFSWLLLASCSSEMIVLAVVREKEFCGKEVVDSSGNGDNGNGRGWSEVLLFSSQANTS